MESLDYIWNQFYIGIITGAIVTFLVSLFVLWLIRNPLKPKIEKLFEKNQEYTYVAIMNRINKFDKIFEIIYTNLESFSGMSFSEISKEIEFDPKKHTEFTEYKNNFQFRLKKLRENKKDILELIKAKHEFLDPEFQIAVVEYVESAFNFIDELFEDQECDFTLFDDRIEAALMIMNFLENNNIYKIFEENNKFTKKWQEYFDSENQNNNL